MVRLMILRGLVYVLVMVGGALLVALLANVFGLFGIVLCGNYWEKVAFSFFHLWIGILLAQSVLAIEHLFQKGKDDGKEHKE
jgi:hypothetical protein